MNRVLYLAAFLLASAAAVGAALSGEDRLIGAWVIDVKATEDYLRSNKILPDAVLDRMRPLWADMHLVYDATGVQKKEKDGTLGSRTEIHVIMRTEKKTMFTSIDATGKKVTTTLAWDDGAFWQETTHFPRYRERFIRAKATKPSQQPEPTAPSVRGSP